MVETNKIKVLVVDDSAFFRHRLVEMFESDSMIEVIGTAANGADAVTSVDLLKPDVITMDVEMPVMDGISAVRNIVKRYPRLPILMFSSYTKGGAKATLDALDAGATDFFQKPKSHIDGAEDTARRLVTRIKSLGLMRRVKLAGNQETAIPRNDSLMHAVPQRDRYKLVIIGASTGGPVAIQQVLMKLSGSYPLPVVLVVHMPDTFTPTYAERLNSLLALSVTEAKDNDLLKPGHVYLAPGGKQLEFEGNENNMRIRIRASVSGENYRPCVDVAFSSAAKHFTNLVLAIVLTGMGIDGKQGAALLKQKGSTIWSQDEASSVIYGMPHAVEEAGISERILPLQEIGPMLSKVT